MKEEKRKQCVLMHFKIANNMIPITISLSVNDIDDLGTYVGILNNIVSDIRALDNKLSN